MQLANWEGSSPLKKPNKPLCLIPAPSIIANEMPASVAVTLILPVGVCPKGINPNRLQNRIKKKTVIKNGMYFGESRSPRLGRATSSRINMAMASIALAKPEGMSPRRFVEIVRVRMSNREATHIMTRCPVMDISMPKNSIWGRGIWSGPR